MNVYHFDGWVCDPLNLVLSKSGKKVRLERRVMDVLELLLRRAPEVVTADEILSTVWSGVIVGDNALHRAIALIRRSLGDKARDPIYIESIPRTGYRFVSKVEKDVSSEEPLGRGSVWIKALSSVEGICGDEFSKWVGRFLGWYSPSLRVLRAATPKSADYIVETSVSKESPGHCLFEWEVLYCKTGELVECSDFQSSINHDRVSRKFAFEAVGMASASAISKHWATRLRRANMASELTYWDCLLIADHFRTMREAQIEEREHILVSAIEKEPRLPYAHAAYANLLSWKIANGITEDPNNLKSLVKDAVETALELDPSEPYTLAHCGLTLCRIGDLVAGVQLCGRAKDLAPSIANLEHHALALSFAGEAKEARATYKLILDHAPNGRFLQFGRAAIPSIQLGDFHEAIGLLEKATSHFPRDFYPWVTKANCLAQIGEMETAQAALQKAFEIMPSLTLDDIIKGTLRTYARNDNHAKNLIGGFERLNQPIL